MKFAYLIEPPFNYKTAQGQVTGCDVELARTVLKMIGIDDFEPVETEFAELLAGLGRGDWRMTTGLFATQRRRQIADFSRPIWALPDGLLIKPHNLKGFDGYRAFAQSETAVLAVIRDQFQHHSALEFGVPQTRILIFDTYNDAAQAVLNDQAQAYASVARAHSGFLQQNPELDLVIVTVPENEKPAQFGCFAFSQTDQQLKQEIDQALNAFIGTHEHRVLMQQFGFNDEEIKLVSECVARVK